MADSPPDMPHRRAILRDLVGLGVLPVVWRAVDTRGASLISTANAADFPGAAAGDGDVCHIPAATAPSSRIAEWYDSTQTPGNGYSIAATQAGFEKAPATASRYEAKLYVFPSGTLRTLHFRKEAQSFHLITFETVIYILSGTAILTPLENHPGKPVTVRAGDALFLPSGVLKNPKPTQDLVILQGFVERTVRDAKRSVVTSKEASTLDAIDWRAENNSLRAKTYSFDGNTLRVITLDKGRSAHVAARRTDILVYVAKGKARRRAGEHTAQIVGGDCIRETAGAVASWESLEETTLVAMDARLNPAMLPPDQNV